MKIKLYLLSLLLHLVALIANSQIHNTAGGFSIKSYGVKSYGMHSRNFAVIQDKRGIMYFGNAYGVIEYDGNTWNNISIPNGNSALSLGQDIDGRIYVGSFNELGYLSVDHTGNTVYKSLNSSLPEHCNQFGPILGIYAINQKIVFHTHHKLLIYQNGKFEIISPAVASLSFSFVGEIGNQMYVVEEGRGLQVFKGNKLQLVENGQALISRLVKDIFSYKNNKLLIVEENGLYEFDAFSYKSLNVSSSNILSQQKITKAIKLFNGNFLIGTYKAGVFIADSSGNILKQISTDKGLPNNTINDTYCDANGGLWLAMDNGISFLDMNTPLTFLGRENGVYGMGYAVAYFKNKIYLGTSQGLYCSNWEPDKGLEKFKQISEVSGQVWDLSVIDNTLLCSHTDNVYQILDDKAKLIKGEFDFDGNWKMVALKGNPGYAVKGTYLGFQLYHLEAGIWKYVTKISGFEESARVFVQDENNALWVCHGNKGLYRIKLSNDFKSISSAINYSDKNGYAPDFFNDVSIVNEQLVLSSDEGPFVFDYVKEVFVRYEALENIIGKNKFINRVTQFDNGSIWLFSGNDLYCYQQSINGDFKSDLNAFRKISGEFIGSYEFVYPLSLSTYIMGTQEGFVIFNQNEKLKKKNKYMVGVRKVESSFKNDSILYGGNNEGRSLLSLCDLPYSLNSLRITYSAFFYEDPDKVKYQYALVRNKAKDIKWSGWTNNTQVDFSDLREGNYIFYVRAKNLYNEISEESSLSFVILAPWYRTFWAFGIYILLAVAASIVLIRVIKERFRKQKLVLEYQSQKELQLLEQKHVAERLLAEKELIELRNMKLESEVVLKNNELASLATTLTQKIEFLSNLKGKLEALNKERELPEKTSFTEVIKTIDQDLDFDDNWTKFQLHFDELHNHFLHRLRIQYPKLNPSWLILCAYIRMNKSNKEIATLMSISVAGVEKRKYRLREKLELENEDKLSNFIADF